MTSVTLTRPTVEHLSEPLGLAILRPRFGWVLDAAGVRGVRQTAYELEVYREEEDQPSWTTGRVVSTQSVLVEYAGPGLLSGIRYAWRVRVWCEADERREAVSAWAASCSYAEHGENLDHAGPPFVRHRNCRERNCQPGCLHPAGDHSGRAAEMH